MKVGTRVLAISHTDASGAVHVYGEGVYEGDFIFEDVTSADPLTDEERLDHNTKVGIEGPFSNPRIRLDDGRIVWGCECWWGAVEIVEKRLGDRVRVPANIDLARAKLNGVK